jgi:hypothetical protein
VIKLAVILLSDLACASQTNDDARRFLKGITPAVALLEVGRNKAGKNTHLRHSSQSGRMDPSMLLASAQPCLHARSITFLL